VAWIAPHNTYLSIAMIMINAFGANWTQGLYFPEGMNLFPEIKGITASLLTSARLFISALVVGCTSAMYNGTIYPIAFVVCGVTIVSFATVIWYENRKVDIPAGMVS